MKKSSQFIFKPSKKLICSRKPKTNILDFEFYKPHSISKTQKLFSTISPVRPFNRFIKPKISNTGVDPIQTFKDFINKDFPKPYRRDMTFLYKRNNKKFDTENSKWSIGTTCNCRREELLPKIDPYKEYHFLPKNDNNKINKLKLTYLSTDHISIKTPDPNLLKTIDIIKDNKKSILKLKELNFNSESNSFWAPFTHSNDNDFNRSSVNYNIINYSNNTTSGKREMSIIEKSINNKKKGVTEFYNLQRTFEPNFRPKYTHMLEENDKRFMKYKGIFTQLYDSYNKNGNVYQPFSKSNSNEKIFNKRNNLKIII